MNGGQKGYSGEMPHRTETPDATIDHPPEACAARDTDRPNCQKSRQPGRLVSEATALAGSGFMGIAAGGALPAAGLAPFIAHMPPIAVPLLAPVILIATGQLGLNPVAVIALLGAAMPNPAAFGISFRTVSTAWNATFTFSALLLSWLAIVAMFILL